MRITKFFLLAACLLLAGTGCSQDRELNLLKNPALNQEINKILRLMEDESEEIRFVLVNQISELLSTYGDIRTQILFLTDYVETHALDSFNSYYLFKVADLYEELKAYPMSVHYYERILNNYTDIKVEQNSIHYLCVKKLLQYVTSKEKHVDYYKLLLSRYIDKTTENIGNIYYELARTYEDLGEWERAIQEYLKFLKHPETKISGDPDAYDNITAKVKFYYSNKRWTRTDLDGLVRELRYALLTKNFVKLKTLESEIDFFTKYWNQKHFDKNRASFFNFSNFLLNSDVWVNPGLDMDSNATEAYLKTRNWAYRVPVWYFYFRKIDFPADPEYDGRWEWAGILFGEK